MLQYHQKTCDLLGLTPRVSDIALRWLDQLEEKHGVKFPAAVREWYSIIGLIDLSIQEPPVFRYVGIEEIDNALGLNWLELDGHLPVKHDSFGRGAYFVHYVELNSIFDDPVVMLQDRYHKQPYEHSQVADRFSDMIFTDFWDFGFRNYWVWISQPKDYAGNLLSDLETCFTKLRIGTKTPYSHLVRYFAPHTRVILEITTMDIRIHTDTYAAIFDALEKLKVIIGTPPQIGNTSANLRSILLTGNRH